MDIERHKLKSNGWFGLFEIVENVKKYHAEWEGTDDCIRVLNFCNGEVCFKRVYENNKGLHFKHTGARYEDSPTVHYLKDFTETVTYIPYQIIEE